MTWCCVEVCSIVLFMSCTQSTTTSRTGQIVVWKRKKKSMFRGDRIAKGVLEVGCIQAKYDRCTQNNSIWIAN